MADGDLGEGFVFGGHTRDPLHRLVIKSTNYHPAKLQGRGLEENVLGGVTGFHLDIAAGALPVFAGGPPIDCTIKRGRGEFDHYALHIWK